MVQALSVLRTEKETIEKQNEKEKHREQHQIEEKVWPEFPGCVWYIDLLNCRYGEATLSLPSLGNFWNGPGAFQ